MRGTIWATAAWLGLAGWGALQAQEAVEKPELTFGFIRLTDMAPLAIAYENGYFAEEGLDVTLKAQSNWKALLDGVIDGELDGAHMLAGQPLAATIGVRSAFADAHVITPFSMDLNGNAVTVSNEVWGLMRPSLPENADGLPEHPIGAQHLLPAIEAFEARGDTLRMGTVFPVSTHNYELRYWLAAGGIHPGYYADDDLAGQTLADVPLSVTPPPQMPGTLEAGFIDGYCVGEPWNQQAVFEGIGVPVVTDHQIWRYNPEKVFGLTAAFERQHPNTVRAVTRALIRAGAWLDATDETGHWANREAAAEILARPGYVGAPYEVIANSMTGLFEFEPGDKRAAHDFNLFFERFATYPYASDAVWYLTQMRRWGQIREAKPDAWYDEVAHRVYRPDIYLEAARSLVEDGLAPEGAFPWGTDGYKPDDSGFIDGVAFTPRQPNAYLEKFAIGLRGEQTVSGGEVR